MSDSAHSDQTELERLLRKGRPWLEENATALIYLVAAVLAIAAVVVYFNRSPSGNVEASQQLLLANTPEEYRDVADAFPETPIGVWARLREADRLLDDGISHLFTDRETGAEELADAEAAYNRLAERTDIDEEIRERIMVGLARLAETKNDGSEPKVTAAVEAWQTLLDAFPESLLKEHAEARIERLKTEDSKAFYAWFSEQNPTPAAPATGLDASAPAVPQVPDLEELLKGTTTPTTELPTPATPAPADPKPADPETEPADQEATETESNKDSADAAPVKAESEPAAAESAPTTETDTEAADTAPAPAESTPEEAAPSDNIPAIEEATTPEASEPAAEESASEGTDEASTAESNN